MVYRLSPLPQPRCRARCGGGGVHKSFKLSHSTLEGRGYPVLRGRIAHFHIAISRARHCVHFTSAAGGRLVERQTNCCEMVELKDTTKPSSASSPHYNTEGYRVWACGEGKRKGISCAARPPAMATLVGAGTCFVFLRVEFMQRRAFVFHEIRAGEALSRV